MCRSPSCPRIDREEVQPVAAHARFPQRFQHERLPRCEKVVQSARAFTSNLDSEVDARLPGKGNSNSYGARPVHLITTMIKWIRTSRLSLKKWYSCRLRGGAASSSARSPFPAISTQTPARVRDGCAFTSNLQRDRCSNLDRDGLVPCMHARPSVGLCGAPAQTQPH